MSKPGGIVDGRCSWSDLEPDQCAHCLGQVGLPVESEVRPLTVATGVVVWPRKEAPARPAGTHERLVIEQPDEVEVSPVTKVARDLTAIIDLYQQLREQAEHHGGTPHMPGGSAMVQLGSVANIEAWENRQQATERYEKHPDERLRRVYTSVADEDPDEAWSAFQLLEFWSEGWRSEHGQDFEPTPHRPRPTVESEAKFLRWVLNWAWDNEPHWDDFAGDVNRARVKLENLLSSGRRHERSRIECDRCAAKPGLLVFRGVADDGSDDRWKCPGCKHRFTPDDVQRAHAKMLRSEGAERWVPQADAISLLKAQGRPEPTVRDWLKDGHGCGYCDPITHQVWVWWPDLWRKHLMTPRRNRATTTA